MAGYATIKRKGITCKDCLVKMLTYKTDTPYQNVIRRRRKCPKCNSRITTTERQQN